MQLHWKILKPGLMLVLVNVADELAFLSSEDLVVSINENCIVKYNTLSHPFWVQLFFFFFLANAIPLSAVILDRAEL